MRALVVDDIPATGQTLKLRLTQAKWDAVVCGNLREALAATEAGSFDVAFVDDMLPAVDGAEPTREATVTIPQIRDRLRQAYIIAFTQTFPPERPHYKQELEDAGADEVVDRDDTFRLVPELSAKVAAKRAALSNSFRILPAKDLATLALLEDVGIETVSEIGVRLWGAGSADAEALGGGMSGEHVVRLTVRGEGPLPRYYVLKLSRTATAIQAEFSGAPDRAEQFFSVGMDRKLEHSVNGWWAGVSPLIPNPRSTAQSLGNKGWKHGVQLANKVWSLLQPHFVVAISEPPASVTMTARFLRSIELSLGEIELALDSYGSNTKATKASVALLRAHLRDGLGSPWPFSRKGERWVTAHGDFHARNVIWAGQTPQIIDWARRSVAPRCVDACCMIVDLFCSPPDRTLKQLWDFRSIGEDVRVLASCAAVRVQPQPPRGGGAAGAFVVTLVANMASSGATEAEVRRAMTFQLLRYLRFQSLPLARRAMAALAAAKLIQFGVADSPLPATLP